MVLRNDMSSTSGFVTELKDFIEDGRKLGFDVPSHLGRKLDTVLDQETEGDTGRIKVALVGGFSVGKTSIVASWLGEQKANMKINVGESSSEVEIYYPNDTYQIIDTPGLYGRGGIDSPDKREVYKEKTRGYVSEAHVLLYVLEPENPIKESHKDELNWLFRQLDLLPRTVFVLSQFDQVADIRDEEEYQEVLTTKTASVKERLTSLIGLTEAEAEALSAVAVSAAPDGKSVDDWLRGDRQEYEALSHMPSLRAAIDDKVEQAGGYEALTQDSAVSMIRDVLQSPFDFAKARSAELKQHLFTCEDTVKNEEKLISEFPDKIKSVSSDTLKSIKEIFDHLRQDVKSSTMETLPEMLERRLGEDGSKLSKEVKSIYDTQVGPLRRDMRRQFELIPAMKSVLQKHVLADDSSLKIHGAYDVSRSIEDAPWMKVVDKMTSFMGNKAFTSMLGHILGFDPLSQTATKAVAGETAKKAAKMFAGKTAKNAAKQAATKAVWVSRFGTFMPLIGTVGAMVADYVKDKNIEQKMKEFNDWKQEVVSSLNKNETSVEEQMKVSNFLETNFPYWNTFLDIVEKDKQHLEEQKQKVACCEAWLKQGEELEKQLQAC